MNDRIRAATYTKEFNEYRTVLFAIDADNFMECHRMVMLNSFVEKGTKQYPAEIRKAERLLKEWEDSL